MKISVRVSRLTDMAKVKFQASHDFRNKIPKYANANAQERVNVIVGTDKTDKDGVIRQVTEDVESTKKRTTNSKSAKAWTGLITFSHEAQAVFRELDKEERRKYYEKAIGKIEEFTGAKVYYAVEHLDEQSYHLHFMISAKDRNNIALSKACFQKKSSFSKLQDKVAEAFADLGFERGTKKEELLKEAKNASIILLKDNKSNTVSEMRRNIEMENALRILQAKKVKDIMQQIVEEKQSLQEEPQIEKPPLRILGYVLVKEKDYKEEKQNIVKKASLRMSKIKQIAIDKINEFIRETKERYGRLEEIIRENIFLRKKNEELEVENCQLKAQNANLKKENEELHKKIAYQNIEIIKLKNKRKEETLEYDKT